MAENAPGNAPVNDPENESIITITAADWKALNTPEPPMVQLARKLVAIDNLTVRDTILSVESIPMIFSMQLLPEGLEPGTPEVNLLEHFYNTGTICNVPGCNAVLSAFSLRMLHVMRVHERAGKYACGERTCLCLFEDFYSGREHFAAYHMDRVSRSVQPNHENNEQNAA